LHVEVQASEGESESSEGSSDEEERDEEERAGTLLLVLPQAVDPVHLLVKMKVLQGAKIKRIGRRRRRRRRRGTMKKGRRMSNLPLHQRTLRRKIQGRNPRGEGSLDRQLVC
jgi:hypothetical protein